MQIHSGKEEIDERESRILAWWNDHKHEVTPLMLSEIAKKGVPASIRKQFYMTFFGIEKIEKEVKYFNTVLLKLVRKYDYLIDEGIKDDCLVRSMHPAY